VSEASASKNALLVTFVAMDKSNEESKKEAMPPNIKNHYK
jgi:hypothetical protein